MKDRACLQIRMFRDPSSLGTDVKTVNGKGKSPLFLAAHSFDGPLVRALLEQDALF